LGPSIVFLTTYWSVATNYISPVMRYIPYSRLIAGPCFWDNNHWGIIGFDRIERKGFWGDPFNSYNLTTDHKKRFEDVLVKFKVINEIEKSFIFERVMMTQQTDGWSCGIHALKGLKRLSNNKLIHFLCSKGFVNTFKSKFLRKIIRRLLL
jgi:hypothetical protein